MPIMRQVITTLSDNGEEVMGPTILAWKYPHSDIVNGSLLTVESNHFCVLKSRGAVLDVYEMGQYPVQTPDKAIIGSIQAAFFGGTSPWQYEALYINRAKLVASINGVALSREMAEMSYNVDYYVHVETKDAALLLVQHMPFQGHSVTTQDLNLYAGPVIDQAINQLLQVTPLEQVNERIHELSTLVTQHLQEFLALYGISLQTVKVLVRPKDERMRALIALKAFGLQEMEAVRYYTAMMMAERGVISAPNMAVGEPFQIGGLLPTLGMNPLVNVAPGPPPPPPAAPPPPHAGAGVGHDGFGPR